MFSQVWEWITGGVGYLLGALKVAAASIVGRVLGTMGLSLATFQTVLPDLKGFVQQHTSGLTGEAASFLGAIGLGQAMSMILSAYAVRMAWKVMMVPVSAITPGS